MDRLKRNLIIFVTLFTVLVIIPFDYYYVTQMAEQALIQECRNCVTFVITIVCEGLTS